MSRPSFLKQRPDGSEWQTWNILPTGVFNQWFFWAREDMMNGLIYLIGLIVVILFILSFLGLR